jgi:hypothetical protein
MSSFSSSIVTPLSSVRSVAELDAPVDVRVDDCVEAVLVALVVVPVAPALPTDGVPPTLAQLLSAINATIAAAHLTDERIATSSVGQL